MKVKSILVSQPEPKAENSPFHTLASKQKVKIDFRPFIHVESIPTREFRKEKINPRDFKNVILTSKNAVDNYFRVLEDMRIPVSNDIKYFCISEAIAYYLQKYVVYRKRKIYFGKQTMADLIPMLKKHKDDAFFFPTSDILKPSIPEVLEKNGIEYKRAILYRTVQSDLSDLSDVYYDILVFFSPEGIKSLFKNFPDFEQNNTRIATFGTTTTKAAKEAGLEINIMAPTPECPSMTKAIEEYIKVANK
ncbi:MAG: uroporphyrinogen-III synthase [Schleiferiaceae bacterium]|jgi:uroporphyrinogen-III synthase|nr:uroporphyrinogen-III synthase [Schleiferiaceae bacterium]